MSKFKLGGVPHHAKGLFRNIRKKVSGEDGKKWTELLQTVLEEDDPNEAKVRFEQQKTYHERLWGQITFFDKKAGLAVVKLKKSIKGKKKIILSNQTRGFAKLLTAHSRVKVGKHVEVTTWKKEVDVLIALDVIGLPPELKGEDLL